MKKTQSYSESCLKRSFPYVSLTLDHAGKNIVSDGTIENVYVKVPESVVSVSSILQEVGSKIGAAPEDLQILDATSQLGRERYSP